MCVCVCSYVCVCVCTHVVLAAVQHVFNSSLSSLILSSSGRWTEGCWSHLHLSERDGEIFSFPGGPDHTLVFDIDAIQAVEVCLVAVLVPPAAAV